MGFAPNEEGMYQIIHYKYREERATTMTTSNGCGVVAVLSRIMYHHRHQQCNAMQCKAKRSEATKLIKEYIILYNMVYLYFRIIDSILI
jgi:hypothetical protein